jgi:hypothetical protein
LLLSESSEAVSPGGFDHAVAAWGIAVGGLIFGKRDQIHRLNGNDAVKDRDANIGLVKIPLQIDVEQIGRIGTYARLLRAQRLFAGRRGEGNERDPAVSPRYRCPRVGCTGG